ncbi:MAG TPA: hypothetical protein VH723_03710 [Candidatus Limnocylindrales bacterium]|jgi:hypothetical protein
MSDVVSSPADRVSWRSAMVGGVLGALSSPATWPVALAGFLARGGLILFVAPIMVIPTPAGVSNVIAPWLVPFYFGILSAGFVGFALVGVTAVLAWIVAGGLVGAWADVELIRRGASNEEMVPTEVTDVPGATVPTAAPDAGRALVANVFIVRLAAHAPLAIALAWGAGRIYEATYLELTNPLEVVSPLVVRIASAVPDALLAVAVAWLVGEAAGSLAERSLVLDPGSRSLAGAFASGYRDLIRRPSAWATLALTTAGLLLSLGPSLAGAWAGWSWARYVLRTVDNGPAVVASIGAFVGLWLGGLALAAGVASWRSHAWTAEWLRHRTPVRVEVGTIGGSASPRPGGWSASGSSGTV